MRVIAGKARGHKLFSVAGFETRPTADRVREAIFSTLAARITGARVCDFFSGTGAMGIEALSRGAESAVFIDLSSECVSVILRNLEKTRLLQHSEIIKGDAVSTALSLSKSGRSFDIIFLDPPYNAGIMEQTLSAIASGRLLAKDGVISAETAPGYELILPNGFDIIRIKDYNIARIYYIGQG